jgi:uncharacterized protein (DUF486 family)
MKIYLTLILLICSNVFMTLAWYGHLKFKEWGWFKTESLFVLILLSWSLAFAEYCFQVPANRFGYKAFGGPFTLVQLKVIQEVITLSVFTVFSLLFFREESLRWNHLAGFVCLVMAVYFLFKK